MKTLICDLCGETINGAYKEVYNSHTEGISRATVGKWDVCESCWKMFTQFKRIPIVNFPNMEVDNGENR